MGKSNLSTSLPPGTYEIRAELDGHRPSMKTVTLESGQKPIIDLPLVATTAALQLLTTSSPAEAYVDSQLAGTFKEGQFAISSLQPGWHAITVKSPEGQADFTVKTPPNPNELTAGSVKARNLVAILACSKVGGTVIFGSKADLAVTIDGVSAGRTQPQGLHLPSLQPGAHEVAIGDPEQRRSFSISIGDQPLLTAFVHPPRPEGSLIVMTGEDGVSVTLNGRPAGGVTQNGELRVNSLYARDYQVQVSKPGFETPPQQQIRISAGKQAVVQFRMSLPKASLELSGAPADTAVLLDTQPVGSVGGDGAFSLTGIDPGDHVLELRKDNFTPRQIPVRLTGGQTARLGREDTILSPVVEAPATVRFRLTPPSPQASVTLTGTDQRTLKPDLSRPLTLPKGEYSITAQASGYDPRTERIRLEPGETKDIVWALNRKTEPSLFLKEARDWDKPERWSQEGELSVVQGGDTVLLRRQVVPGTITFVARMQKGKRLQWVLNYQDDKDYALFQLDKENFSRSGIINGDTKRLARVPHQGNFEQPFEVQVIVRQNSIIHKLRQEGQWRTIDEWSDAQRDLSAGRFGFIVPGRDRMALSKFILQPAGPSL